MSSEVLQANNQEIDGDKKNDNQNNNDNIDVDELVKNKFVRDLLVKIDVLKKGILEYRKNNISLSEKIKELEVSVKEKSEEIKSLTEEKEEYEKKIEEQQEKEKEKKKEEGRKRSKSVTQISGEEISKLNEEIAKLKIDNEALVQKVNHTLIETERIKQEYKMQIKLLSENNASLLGEIKKLESEKNQLNEKIKEANSIALNYAREKEHFDVLLKEYRNSKEEAMHQMEACLEKCSKLVVENKTYQDSIYMHESDARKMAEKLSEYKNMLIQINLRTQIYHVRKIGMVSSNEMDIIFGKDKNGNYIMRIDEKNKSEMINIQDVESINIIDIKKNKVEINYMNKAKKYTITVVVDGLIIDQFVEAYKNFYSQSMKSQI